MYVFYINNSRYIFTSNSVTMLHCRTHPGGAMLGMCYHCASSQPEKPHWNVARKEASPPAGLELFT